MTTQVPEHLLPPVQQLAALIETDHDLVIRAARSQAAPCKAQPVRRKAPLIRIATPWR